jgi:hypothetical protein
MAHDNSIKVKRNKKAVSRIIDGEVVVLIPDEKFLHALGGCGIRIWELIEKETSVSDRVDIICDEYEVEPETARQDIIEFVKELETLKLAEISTEMVGEVDK